MNFDSFSSQFSFSNVVSRKFGLSTFEHSLILKFEMLAILKFDFEIVRNFNPHPSLNSMGKIAKGVNKINCTMLYGNYCYIIIENFPQKFSPCSMKRQVCITSAPRTLGTIE